MSKNHKAILLIQLPTKDRLGLNSGVGIGLLAGSHIDKFVDVSFGADSPKLATLEGYLPIA